MKRNKRGTVKNVLEDTEQLQYSVDLSDDGDFNDSPDLEYSISDLSEKCLSSEDEYTPDNTPNEPGPSPTSKTEQSDLESSSSSDESSSDESMPDGLRPFDFEPVCSAQEMSCSEDEISGKESIASNNSNDEQKPRKGNTDWCLCGSCKVMETEVESLCCLDTNEIKDDYFEGNQCISESIGFESVCLSKHSLKAAITAKKYYKQNNDPNKDQNPQKIPNEAFRYAAYRQFVFWVYDNLQQGERKVIPSCAVWKIRERFEKSTNEKYVQFKFKE
ncbi:uncharacterized protein [Clytia hemisphaerica]|uniref:uncharacterized protein n=1 Tax=Clytia hemisphaerica TaxID=252671 RepID=UPI0034D5966E